MLGTVFVGAVAYAIVVKDHLSTPFDDLFNQYGKVFMVDPNLLRGIGRHESGFRNVVSEPNKNKTRDYGIMQINETNFKTLGLDHNSVMIPAKNIEAGARLLSMVRNELGERDSIFTRISAYNAGSPSVIKYGITNEAYTSSVYWHFTLYQMGRVFQ